MAAARKLGQQRGEARPERFALTTAQGSFVATQAALTPAEVDPSGAVSRVCQDRAPEEVDASGMVQVRIAPLRRDAAPSVTAATAS